MNIAQNLVDFKSPDDTNEWLTPDERLIRNGYEPIIADGKIPVTEGWQASAITAQSIASDREAHPHATNTGLRTGALSAFDIDIVEPEHVAKVEAVIETFLGPTPLRRVGAKGCTLYYRNASPVPKITIKGTKDGKVEILGQGQQSIVFGIHPDTGKPFKWTKLHKDYEDLCLMASPLSVPFAELPLATPEQLHELAPQLATLLTELEYGEAKVSGTGDYTPPPAASDIELDLDINIRRGRDYIDSEVAAGRVAIEGSANNTTYAIAARMRDYNISRDAALDLIAKRFNPYAKDKQGRIFPFSDDELQTIVEDAYKYGQNPEGAGSRAVRPFEEAFGHIKFEGGNGPEAEQPKADAPFEDPDDVFSEKLTDEERAEEDDADNDPVSIDDLLDEDLPEQEWLLDQRIPLGTTTSIYGNGGVGKGAWIRQACTAIAAGAPMYRLEGMKAGCATKKTNVLYVSCEDGKRRIRDDFQNAAKYLGVELKGLPIKIWNRVGRDSYLAILDAAGQIAWQPFSKKLFAYLKANPGTLCILDGFTDIVALDEYARIPVNRFYKVVLGRPTRKYNATFVVIAHPSKASMADGSWYSGNTQHRNAVRHMLVMQVPEDAAKSMKGTPARRLEILKTNLGGSQGEGQGEDLRAIGGAFKLPMEVVQPNTLKHAILDIVYTVQCRDAKRELTTIQKQDFKGTFSLWITKRLKPFLDKGTSKPQIRALLDEMTEGGILRYHDDGTKDNPSGWYFGPNFHAHYSPFDEPSVFTDDAGP